jgi:hypothetical protein
MTNEEKYLNAFVTALEVSPAEAPPSSTAKARRGQRGHMALIAALEDAFDIMMEMDDIIDLSSFEKGKEILRKYAVEI